jgi:sRNA-binding carbon storage regulator CsrA
MTRWWKWWATAAWAVKGDRIRLGIEAPPSVVVDRQEIHERRKHSPDGVPHP